MKEIVKQQYDNLITENANFRQFVEKMDKLSNDEIKARYELKNDIISYFLDL